MTVEPSQDSSPDLIHTLADLFAHLGTEDWSGVEDWVAERTDDAVFLQLEGDDEDPDGIIVVSGTDGTLVEFPLDIQDLIAEVEAADGQAGADLQDDDMALDE